MSDSKPDLGKDQELPRELSHAREEKSITGSAQSLGIEPSDDFVAPTMALDAYEPEPDE